MDNVIFFFFLSFAIFQIRPFSFTQSNPNCSML